MFDIGFPELLLVGIVALLVIGPDKLPETVRTVALWIGRIRRSLSEIKTEIENEIGADEIRRQLHNESIMKELDKTKNHIGGIINDAKGQINEIKESASLDAEQTDQPEKTLPDTSDPEPTDQPQQDDGRKHSESGG
ncbi:MAG TPA: Sec-independent protein translocase protein TatB [Pseudomonadales bacterium]|nr:Sec-independent protein translocase protein TatB [Pseudomonadales bacterium]